jgi:hypothetical protein
VRSRFTCYGFPKSCDQSADFCSVFQQPLEVWLREITEALPDHQLRFRLSDRAVRDRKPMRELRIRTSTLTLGDVGRNRNAAPSKLIRKPYNSSRGNAVVAL